MRELNEEPDNDEAKLLIEEIINLTYGKETSSETHLQQELIKELNIEKTKTVEVQEILSQPIESKTKVENANSEILMKEIAEKLKHELLKLLKGHVKGHYQDLKQYFFGKDAPQSQTCVHQGQISASAARKRTWAANQLIPLRFSRSRLHIPKICRPHKLHRQNRTICRQKICGRKSPRQALPF